MVIMGFMAIGSWHWNYSYIASYEAKIRPPDTFCPIILRDSSCTQSVSGGSNFLPHNQQVSLSELFSFLIPDCDVRQCCHFCDVLVKGDLNAPFAICSHAPYSFFFFWSYWSYQSLTQFPSITRRMSRRGRRFWKETVYGQERESLNSKKYIALYQVDISMQYCSSGWQVF